MSTQRPSSPEGPSSNKRTSGSALHAAHEALADLRLSLDSDRSSRPSSPAALNGLNGKTHPSSPKLNYVGGSPDRVQQLEQVLKQTREEKDALATQYQNLLAKLTAMRTTLGNKLKQDAEELDRREQLIQQLELQNEDLTSTVDTLKSELIASNDEGERVSKELETMRTRAFEENSQEVLHKERALLEAQNELERCRIERDEWERAMLQERVALDESRSISDALRRDLDLERDVRERQTGELEAERERTRNLQSVLEDFQSAREHELRQAVGDLETQLTQATQSLAEYKHRALTAELQLEESTSSTARAQELEKDVKEKNLLIAKLRHEGVIMNEHLTEALRRLKRNASENHVDRRLITNVLLQFLVTPRNDTKRFEMLTLLASVLSWNDIEREKAGLQRVGGPAQPTSIWGRASTSSPKGKATELEKTDETESFSRMWVEFLLKEATSGTSENSPSPTNSPNSLPGTPTYGSHGLGHSRTPSRRLSSFNSLASLADPKSPTFNLSSIDLAPPPRRGKGKEKGKEREEAASS